MTLRDPGSALVASDIDRAILALGRGPWPQDYVHYMLRFNGAHPLVTSLGRGKCQHLRLWWPIGSHAAEYGHTASVGDMHRLLGDPTEMPDLLDVHGCLGHRLPPSTMAFSSTDGGSCFLFDLRPDRYGQVLFWCRLWQGDAQTQARDPYHNVAWVADNLVDFFNRILEEPDDWDEWEANLPPDAERNWRPT